MGQRLGKSPWKIASPEGRDLSRALSGLPVLKPISQGAVLGCQIPPRWGGAAAFVQESEMRPLGSESSNGREPNGRVEMSIASELVPRGQFGRKPRAPSSLR
jgi:hypothetical protein